MAKGVVTGVRTCFELDERDEYHAARTLLSRRCLDWSQRASPTIDHVLIASALDSRHYSSDGRLTYWRPEHVRHFLLEWVPRYLDAHVADVTEAPEALRLLLRFINAYGLRDPRGASLADNEAAIDEAALSYPEVLAADDRFPIERYWIRLARAHGTLIDGPDSLQSFQFRARRDGLVDDGRLLDGVNDHTDRPMPGAQRAPAQLPVELPGMRQLAEAAMAVPVLAQVRRVVDWLAAGRALDVGGGLTGADRAELAAEVGLTDLDEVDRLVDWMIKARIIRRYRKRLVPVAKARPRLSDPIALWSSMFDAVGRMGSGFLAVGRHRPESGLRDGFRRILPDILSSLYSLPSAMPIKRLEETVWWHCCGALFDLDELEPTERRRQRELLRVDLATMWRRLADLGVVEHRFGVADPVFSADLAGDGLDSPFDPDTTAELATELRLPTELVRLTDLATYAMRERMLAEGREAGLVGELVQADAQEMLGVVTQHYPSEAAASELTGWLKNRGRDLESLLDVARATPLRSRAAAILELLYDVDPSSVKLLRRMRSDPVLAPTALVCLVELGVLDLVDLTDEEHGLLAAESSLRLMELDGPESIVAGLEELPHRDARRVLHQVLSSGHPDRRAMSEFRRLVVTPLRRTRMKVPPGKPVMSLQRLGSTRRARLKRDNTA